MTFINRYESYKALTFVIAAFSSFLCNATWAQWSPEKTTEMIVTAGPGGNQDQTARMIQQLWQIKKITSSPVVVINKPGGGGGIAANYISQHAEDPHYMMMLAPTLMTSRISGTNKVDYTDYTPLAMLFTESIYVSVRMDSPIKNGKDFIQTLRKNPDSLSIAVASAIGNHIHMGVALPMKAAGVDIKRMKFVAFKSSGQSMVSLLGGHVDVAASTFGTLLPHVKAGKIRIIGVSAPQRMTGILANIPTWKEQGANAVFDSWRGVVGAKGITEEQKAYWEQAFAELCKSEEWEKDIEKNFRVNSYLNGKDARRYWDAQYKDLEEALTDLGLAKAR
jgi:putative tricarboxylic transport membrane protein